MDLRENTKEPPILSNFSEKHGSLFAVNSSSVMDCKPVENKYVEYVPMIGAYSSNGTSQLFWDFSMYKRQLLELTLTELS